MGSSISDINNVSNTSPHKIGAQHNNEAIFWAYPHKAPLRPIKGAEFCRYLPKIILAEDDPVMRRKISEKLHRKGYDLILCRDARELLDTISLYIAEGLIDEIDLLVSSTRLSKSTEWNILSMLRRNKVYLPTILLTEDGKEEFDQSDEDNGVALVLDKPFLVSDLVYAVEKIVPTKFRH